MTAAYERHYLSTLFEPASVAVVGATETPGKIGRFLMANMLSAGFRGRLFAVNPKYQQVDGVACFKSLADLPAAVDLAVMATPAATIPRLIAECGRVGIRSAVVITAGFGETGAEGKRLEGRVRAAARRHAVRMLGPNCLGILRPGAGLNASFSRDGALSGSLGLISQSGAVCTAMLDWALVNQVGFSSVVSLGGSVDIDFGEIVDYLAADPVTEHILLYVEGVRDARRFISSLRAAARIKPVILMKVGRHPAGTRAAVSHTGAIVGADDVFDAAVRRAGAVRVSTIGQLVAAAQALTAHVRPRGNRLAIITNGGGPGVMAADRAAELGLALAELSPATLQRLQRALPSNWSHGNPVDLIGDAGSARYQAALDACLADDAVDGALVILTPQAMTEAEDSARAVIEASRKGSKPVVACWMGEASVQEARAQLRRAGIPVFRTPDPAVEMLAHLAAFFRNQRDLLQVPGPLAHTRAPDLQFARQIVHDALSRGRTILTAAESRRLLAAFHIPVVQGGFASTDEEAVAIARDIGFPVALKIVSDDITHKSDVGGVRLHLADDKDLRAAWADIMQRVQRLRPGARVAGMAVEPMIVRPQGRELMLGVMRDAVFGPAISFGAGGTSVEVLHDRSVALPPLSGRLAREMIAGTRVSRLLGAFRGMAAADASAIESVLLRVSEMACELPELRELDINPLVADSQGVIAIDARVLLEPSAQATLEAWSGAPSDAPRDAPAGVAPDAVPQVVPDVAPYAHLAIHPYPAWLESVLTLRDGSTVGVRPIRPEDAAMEQEFVAALSEASRRFRFMSSLRELSPQMLARFTQIDYDREMAFVAVDRRDGREVELAVARYTTYPDGTTCEFALAVADAWQGRGLGEAMLARLIGVARQKGLRQMVGQVLADNGCMLALCRKLDFEQTGVEAQIVTVSLRL